MADGPNRVKFLFNGTTNRELPLIVGQLPVLPKQYWEGKEFERPRSNRRSAAAPIGSRASMPGAPSPWSASRTIGAPTSRSNKGRNNFDEIHFDYYRDPNVALEAFKAGRFDLRVENSSRFWATGYRRPGGRARA